MEQKINVNVSGDTLIVRTGQAENIIEKKSFVIEGDLNSPLTYLSKRKDDINFLSTNLEIDRENMSMLLILFENMDNESQVGGKLNKTKEFISFGINYGKRWIARELAEHIKMNRSSFESKEVANKLAAVLSDVKIKIDKVVENSSGSRGNLRQLKDQTLKECNIPESIPLSMPIFKGSKISVFNCEVWISPEDYSVSLISPDAADIIKEVRDESIDRVKKSIEEICPDLVIIEK